MYCPKCGAPNDDRATICAGCGGRLPRMDEYPPAGMEGRKVPDYLVFAILATLFCCMPFGIVAIVYAAQVNGRLAMGDYRGAAELSEKAQMWCWVSFLLGILPAAFMLLMFILGAAGGALSGGL